MSRTFFRVSNTYFVIEVAV